MFKKVIILLGLCITLNSCDFFPDENEKVQNKKVLIYTNSPDPYSEIVDILITISSEDFKDIVENTTDSLYYTYIPRGKNRKIEVLATLTNGKLFYGKRLIDIDSSTDRVEVRVGDTLYGDINILLEDALIEEVDVGLGSELFLVFGDSHLFTIARNSNQKVRGWFVNGEIVKDYYEDSHTVPSKILLEGRHEVSCLLSENNKIQIDTVKITVAPFPSGPLPPSAPVFNLGPPVEIMWMEAGGSTTTPTSELVYKVVISPNLADVNSVKAANSPNRLSGIIAGWGGTGASYYIYSSPNITFSSFPALSGTYWITVLVSDKFDQMAIYPPVSYTF